MKRNEITDEGAIRLLEAIMKSSADTFKEGITAFIDASIEEERAKENLERAMKRLYKCQQKKMDALCKINDEYHFLKGEKYISPNVDGDFILTKLMKECLREMNTHTRNYAKGLVND